MFSTEFKGVGLHYTAFANAIREDSRQTATSRGVSPRKKFADKANVERRVKEAKYGCIRMLEVTPSNRDHPTLAVASVFNPTPNDTNLEDDDIAQRTYKQIELERRFEKERREKEEKTVWGGIKKMFGAP